MIAPDCRMLTCEECRLIGVYPYAVYGGRVHSFREWRGGESERHGAIPFVVPHGSREYADAVKRVEEKKAAQ